MFRYDAILGLLDDLRDRHGLHRVCEAPDLCSGVLLRHDVDIDLTAALALAEREAAHGIRGTWFVMVTSPSYNPGSATGRGILRRLVELGAEIGLHVDPCVESEPDLGALARRVRLEAELLGHLSGEPVRSVSLHNPSVHGRYPVFDGFVNAYDRSWFSPESYLSDSCMQFRHDPHEFFGRCDVGVMQLLLHAEHYSRDGTPMPAPVVRHVTAHIEQVEAMMSVSPTFLASCPDGLAAAVLASSSD